MGKDTAKIYVKISKDTYEKIDDKYIDNSEV